MPEKRAELSAGPIAYRDTGDGKPILFLHGFLVNGLLWSKVTPLLRDHRCIVPDWPLGSHELPMSADADLGPTAHADLVAEFIESLGIERVTLVGNDSGGAISQITAARHPELIDGLVLASCDAYDVFPPRMFSYLKLAGRIPGAMAVLAQSMRFTPIVRTPIAFGWISKKHIPTDVLKTWLRPVQRSAAIRRDAAKLILGASPKLTMAAAETLRTLDLPVLLAWGAEDRFFPTRLAERLEAELPDARLELIADARTFVPWDQPERLAELIDKFVDAGGELRPPQTPQRP